MLLGGTLQSGDKASSACDFNCAYAIAFESINGGATTLVDQPNTGGGHVILSVPVKLTLKSGTNSITIGSNQNSKYFTHSLVPGGVDSGIVSVRC